MKSGFGSAIGLVNIEGKTPVALDTFLYNNYKIHAVSIQWEQLHGVRITPNVYTTTKNLDLLVEAIKQFVAS
jgi:selenocysteine lyase/cysteine desulfurase